MSTTTAPATIPTAPPAPADNPLVEGLERAPGPPDDARDLRGHRRPVQPQAPAGDLQPRPRGRAARALQPHRRLAQRDVRRGVPRAGARPRSSSSPGASPTPRCSRPCSASCATSRGPSTTTASSSACRRPSTSSTARPDGRCNRCFYLSTAPAFFPVIIGKLGDHGLATKKDVEVRVVIEKPFGTTLEEAQALNQARPVGLRRGPGLPHRPLPGQGDRPEHDGVPVLQRALRAGVEPELRRPRPDHGRRGPRHRLARRLLRQRGRPARPRAEPHAPALCHIAMEPPVALHRRRGPQREGQGPPRDPRRRRPTTVGEIAVRAPVHRRHRRRRGGPGLPRGGGRPAPTRPPRPTRRCASRSRTGAGPACRSTCAPASAWRARSPRSR